MHQIPSSTYVQLCLVSQPPRHMLYVVLFDLVSILAPLVVFLMKLLEMICQRISGEYKIQHHHIHASRAMRLLRDSEARGIGEESYLWQVDVGNNDAVQCARCVLWRVSWVTRWVVLVFEVLSGGIAFGALGLPRHGTGSDVHFGF